MNDKSSDAVRIEHAVRAGRNDIRNGRVIKHQDLIQELETRLALAYGDGNMYGHQKYPASNSS